jgi:hypothetical protein
MGTRVLVSQFESPVIARAKVLDVNPTHYVCTVAIELYGQVLTWVSFASPYQHSANGEGVYCMPEVGSVCWLCWPSDGHMPFILGWMTAQTSGDSSFRANKMDLNPGDIYLGTRDENHLILRRGGIVQIGATPLAQRYYVPIDNVIRDMCENYHLETLGGELSWVVKIPEENKEGKLETCLTLEAMEFADDPKSVATLKIGSHGSGDKTILSLKLRESGAEAAKLVHDLVLSKDGNLTLLTKKDVSWKVEEGKFSLDVKGDVTLKTAGKLLVNATGNMEVAAALTKVGGALPVVLNSTDLATWIAAVTVLLNGTSPGLPVLSLGGTLVAPGAHVSQKLQAG